MRRGTRWGWRGRGRKGSAAEDERSLFANGERKEGWTRVHLIFGLLEEGGKSILSPHLLLNTCSIFLRLGCVQLRPCAAIAAKGEMQLVSLSSGVIRGVIIKCRDGGGGGGCRLAVSGERKGGGPDLRFRHALFHY